MNKLLILALLFISSFTSAQVADFTQMEQYVDISPYDSSFVNFHPYVTHAQKLGIVGQDIYFIDQKCLVETYEFEANGVTPNFTLNCQGNKIVKNLYFDNWYLIGGLEKINAEYEGIEFNFEAPDDEYVFGLDDRKFSKKERYIIKEIKYGKINKTTFSLVVFFENGYVESMDFLEFKPHFISEIDAFLTSDINNRKKGTLYEIIIIVDDKKMLAIE